MKKLTLLTLALVVALAGCAPVEITATATALPPTLTKVIEPTSAPPTATLAPSPVPAPTDIVANPTVAPESLFAPVTDADWQVGPKTAAITLVEYGDFQ